MSQPIRVAFHYWPESFTETEPGELQGRPVARLVDARLHLSAPFPVTFERVLELLESRLNAYTEGDGSFGCSGTDADGRVWRVSGTVVAEEEGVACVDCWLEGMPRDSAAILIGTFADSPENCLVQLPEWGGGVAGGEFLRWLGGE